uniref:Uncharacterized protein n=1 Tax=Acrobeloides nanus TaxID=290746 RepID=A0A914DWW1_9BILA
MSHIHENNVEEHHNKSPDAEPNKVKVTSGESEFPRPISPPAQVERQTLAVSPPLPALLRRMDHENDNPFRPEEPLYHAVDPIVEAYKHRPFPPSPTGSPVPPHESTPVNQKYHPNYSHDEVQLLQSSPRKTPSYKEVDISRAPKNDVNQQANSGYTDLPPPGKVELVHIERKKKCGCCSIQ